jgi:hypothetical protein
MTAAKFEKCGHPLRAVESPLQMFEMRLLLQNSIIWALVEHSHNRLNPVKPFNDRAGTRKTSDDIFERTTPSAQKFSVKTAQVRRITKM